MRSKMTNTSRETARIDLENAAAEGLKLISSAASSALKLMAQQASDVLKTLTDSAVAAKVVSELAAVSAKVVDGRMGSDHEDIIEIKGSIRSIEKSLKALEDAEAVKKNNPTFTGEHERRITCLENSKSIQVTLTSIGIGLLTLQSTLLIYHLIK